MLEVKNLMVTYGAITALHGISLRVQQGDIVTLIGANGAGKTTTLKAISGLLKCRSGEIFFEGRNICNWRPHQIVRLGISQVPETKREPGAGSFALRLRAGNRPDHFAGSILRSASESTGQKRLSRRTLNRGGSSRACVSPALSGSRAGRPEGRRAPAPLISAGNRGRNKSVAWRPSGCPELFAPSSPRDVRR